ncbi:MAG: endopeptidase La [Endozoicomonadaceae bacterium]|nr:endopeptidase La [Endozoicomonadaceae bacterium]
MNNKHQQTNEKICFPLLPLRDVVVFPGLVVPLFVGRAKSVTALNVALENDNKILLVAQKKAQEDDPEKDDLYNIGTVATILQLLKLPDGTVKVLVEGKERAKLTQVVQKKDYLQAEVTLINTNTHNNENSRIIALSRSLVKLFRQYARLIKKIPADILATLSETTDHNCIVDIIATHVNTQIENKQKVIEIPDTEQRQEFMIKMLEMEIEVLEVEKQVRSRVKKQMERNQREYYLTEQMKAIQKELGSDDERDEIIELRKKIDAIFMPVEVKEKIIAEIKKLNNMSSMSAEATVVRNYIDCIASIPWKKKSRLRNNLSLAEKFLNDDHYGLERVKERILEYLAVQQHTRKLKGPVLCLVGPPGVGKTSLGASIAKAVNRHFVRISLGGLHDEAEIRGHRRTYIGSMPGKIIQKIIKSGVKNPLIMLDEIDKIGTDMRGDPASALLEVLDAEQNSSFSDHYLEVDYDLSNVMFICTANSLNIQPALLDRMEIIRIAGYTEDEKLSIAQNYLIPKQLKMHGIKEKELLFSDISVLHLIRFYTKEAGVRSLDREIEKVCRKFIKEKILNKINTNQEKKTDRPLILSTEDIEHYCSVKKFTYGLVEEKNQIGLVTGLAWTELGGELLNVEAVLMAGKGKIIKTGSLGDVMQESIQAALTVVRSRVSSLNIAPDFYEKKDIHIHVPEGATPKDGPSAGIAMCTAIVSVLTDMPVKADLAMTGEINLRGQVLPIGGLKEKLLAAYRGGIKCVAIPYKNVKDLQEIPDNIKRNIDIYAVKWIDEVLELALQTGIPTIKKYNNLMTIKNKSPIKNESDIIKTH